MKKTEIENTTKTANTTNMTELTELEPAIWETKRAGKMNVPARVFANQKLIRLIKQDRTLDQLKNVATLPGIVKYSAVMPDAHEGYGFPIGGVAAFDPQDGGVVSPGGVGFDINCGVRLITVDLDASQIESKKKELIEKIFTNIPSGVGVKGKLRVTQKQLQESVENGVKWAVENNYATKDDLKMCEENGCIEGADIKYVSQKAIGRGLSQMGTVGSGNHFIEIQKIDQIFEPKVAKKFGLEKAKIAIMIHSGSRGFGHQICTDYVGQMLRYTKENKIDLVDEQLCFAPLDSEIAQKYFGAMNCAVNYAFNNRQLMTHWIRESFAQVYGEQIIDSMKLVYDVCHNIAKMEKHKVDKKNRDLCVHRKGATRAFCTGRVELPQKYLDVGQPVLIPGSMGTSSYVLVGLEGAMQKSFGSSCHGAGRMMSRSLAKHTWDAQQIVDELNKKNIFVRTDQVSAVCEEAPGAYKDVDEVVASVKQAGLCNPVAKMIPLGVVKG
jgi:tRNA-splicing ligase RtcB